MFHPLWRLAAQRKGMVIKMKKPSVELLAQIHERLFAILCDIDDYCRENSIVYYLSGGTCLGAARHHGFIPWDDDADIMMPRKEYDRFIQGFRKAYGTKYNVLSLKTDDAWPIPRGMVEDKNAGMRSRKSTVTLAGFAVDIFPIDGLPEKEWRQQMEDKSVKMLLVLRNAAIRKDFYSWEKYRTLKKILGVAVRVFQISPRALAERIDRVSRRYDFDASRQVAVRVTTHYGVRRERLLREDVHEAVYLDFEGRKLPVFNGYKRYLENLYGPDYMQVPTDQKILEYTHMEDAEVVISTPPGTQVNGIRQTSG